ncbi:ABC transporter permease [Halorubrum cibi]|uniref:Peptide/nickel transport system permease protein n=1 Tax=Halorubrum cibi TaxID=413815 RepID=A0A521AWM3_9EURY|nr:ABC transporter permease [Halorubrum cibi]SMO39205.1 peptide/nickel transport system permease protein [Halorubrum cibi]
MSLRRFVLRRGLAVVPVLFGVSAVTFGLFHLTPGDPVSQVVALNPDVSAAEEARLRERWGLSGPVWRQYLEWLSNVLVGDFGREIRTGRAVSAVVWRRVPETLVLGLFGWVFAVAIAIPTGIYAAVNKGEIGDLASRVLALSGVSIPNFWLGLLLILVFSLRLGLFPVLPPSRLPLYHPETLRYLLLPGVTIGTAAAATLTRVMRTSMAEELNEEYVTAARARGLPERTVVFKHVLRNSLVSVVTLAAALTAGIVAGSVVVESVFNWPGLGSEFVQAIDRREINVVMAITLVTAVCVVLANFLADVLYAVLDPRIRYD